MCVNVVLPRFPKPLWFNGAAEITPLYPDFPYLPSRNVSEGLFTAFHVT